MTFVVGTRSREGGSISCTGCDQDKFLLDGLEMGMMVLWIREYSGREYEEASWQVEDAGEDEVAKDAWRTSATWIVCRSDWELFVKLKVNGRDSPMFGRVETRWENISTSFTPIHGQFPFLGQSCPCAVVSSRHVEGEVSFFFLALWPNPPDMSRYSCNTNEHNHRAKMDKYAGEENKEWA